MRKFVYIVLVVVGIVLTVWAARYAYADRGYFAVGGEYSFLLLPLFGAAIEDILDEREYREDR